YTTVVDVDPPAPIATFPWQKSCGRVAKEAQFPVIALKEIQVSRPNKHLCVGFRRVNFGYQTGVNIYRQFVLVKVRQTPHELDVLFRDSNVGYVFQLLELNSIRRERRQASVFRNQPLQITIIQTVEQHLLVVSA